MRGASVYNVQMETKELHRFFAKIKFDLQKGCWLWIAGIDGKGYGSLRHAGRTRRAHKVAFEHWRGLVPEGKELDHVECSRRDCANPWHVEPRTHRENLLRGSAPAALNAVKTHCKHGHSLSGENLYVQKKTGFRYCRTCAKARVEKFQKIRLDKPVSF
jgi:ABC-type uncharacterized transport system ATPase subunit